jgi:hypothetical protein
VRLTELVSLDRPALFERLRQGHPIDPHALDDREYLGVSLGLPRLVEACTWKTFMKVFHRDRDVLRGWNVRLEQRGIDGPVVPKRRGAARRSFGHYRVVPLDGTRGIREGLLLDYGRGGNRRFDPMVRVRDPIVAVNEGDSTLLLGWTYLAAFGRAIGTPSFFALERRDRLTEIVEPPRRRSAG